MTAEHTVVKPEKLVATAVAALEEEAVLPRIIAREGLDQFVGADDDTISYKVEGVLPHHEYPFRNDRSEPIKLDRYSERKIAVTFGGNKYSAVELTDEQADFDLARWAKLLTPQAKAVARGLEHEVRDVMENAPYEVVIGNAEQKLRGAIIEARRVLNKFHAPKGNRILLVGSDFEAAMANDKDLTLAEAVGDSLAESALREALVGRVAGFTVVVDETLEGDAAIAFADSAFFLGTAAPSVPQSKAGSGSTISYGGFALRWMTDYDTMYLRDRSVVNSYWGVRSVTDPLTYWDKTLNGGKGSQVVTPGEYLVRAIKLTLDGESNYPAATSDLAKATGISDAKVWTPTGPAAETDPAND